MHAYSIRSGTRKVPFSAEAAVSPYEAVYEKS
jgi:hypothetical protein